jgi:signal transduction histidine kinase
MNRALMRTRLRLAAWAILACCIVLALVESAVYVAFSERALNEIDRHLAREAERLEDQAEAPPSDFVDRWSTPVDAASVYLVDSAAQQGSPARSFQLSARELPPPGERRTVALGRSKMRLYVRSIEGQAANPVLLAVGQDLHDEEQTLTRLAKILMLGGVGGFVLAVLGAWCLSGVALAPVEAAFMRQQDFVADASHELRTPLTVLQSALDLLDRHRAEPLEQNGRLLDDVRTEVGRMSRLSADLLLLARSDRGALELAVGEIDLGALAAETVRLMVPAAEGRQIKLEHIAKVGQIDVEGDPDRIQQVLLILIDNALKHTPPGGTIAVRSRVSGTSAVLDVEDTGEGIAQEHLSRLFDRFYRADSARSRHDGGSGLGLAIARALIQAHHGRLYATSRLGSGTTVTAVLPLAGRNRLSTGWPAWFGGDPLGHS